MIIMMRCNMLHLMTLTQLLDNIYLCKFKTADDIVQYMSNDYYLKTKKGGFINCLDHTTIDNPNRSSKSPQLSTNYGDLACKG